MYGATLREVSSFDLRLTQESKIGAYRFLSGTRHVFFFRQDVEEAF